MTGGQFNGRSNHVNYGSLRSDRRLKHPVPAFQHARRIRMEMLSQSEISHCAFELIS